MPFVIDNSVICGWFIGNQATAYSDAIGARLFTDRCTAPALLQLEFANVLRTACKRQRLGIEDARMAVDQIESLPIDIDRETPGPAAILSLALRYDLSSYDAAYLELALRKQLPIATQDEALREAAWAAGVGVVREK
ncbi:MAG: type II toxin-antitoxin system VapC family toxin [Aromatoleum sp.]|jgi:predicted nucleic acid-binding protein|uniref:type II toxin-antitoxin system VapC family toxin n=1 Tax=Aromatoleum sp. TaxID=2307007 RepID=UPI0028951EFD|nr:type II toxin-antitoxin system VapC family toxin [Aromatoleum sp.]MDT3672008.1 type II toxin-antitoxin system VapC family toxin [Aromatoleum sp.]